MDEKEITLEYNNYKIPVNIPKNLEGAKKAIKEKLYLNDEQLNSLNIYFLDEDQDINQIEDSFQEALLVDVWICEINKTLNVKDENDIKKDVKKKITKEYQDIINEKGKKEKEKIISDVQSKLKEKFTMYENEVKKLIEENNALKEKNKYLIDKFIPSLVEKLKNNFKNYTESKIDEKLKQYKNNIDNSFINLNSQIKEKLDSFQKEKEQIQKNIEEAIKSKVDIKSEMDKSKQNFNSVLKGPGEGNEGN